MGNKKKTIAIATIKSWNIEEAKKFQQAFSGFKIDLITKSNELTLDALRKINPEVIFFVHWSWKIPEPIFSQFHSIGFHMTDLPYGRGGSPLQNLIVRGITDTKITAFQITEEMDSGAIYLKADLNLSGSADQIFRRASQIIFTKMIPSLLEKPLQPVPQEGEATQFERRSASQGNIAELKSKEEVYDFIRMLDAEGYPPAFLETDYHRLEFVKAEKKDDVVEAKVYIKSKQTS